MSGGNLAKVATASTATPPYVCMAEKEIGEAGDVLAVNRVSKDIIYETSLSAAAASAAPGGKLQVSAGGEQVSTGSGTFEVVSLDGTAAGSIVRGRFA